MKLLELEKVYYHGSSEYLDVGTILTPRKDYENDWQDTDFYGSLEHYRPSNCLSHKESVFMVDNDNDIDNAGGGTEYVFHVIPLGDVQRHDMNWGSEISMLISDGYDISSDEIKHAAQEYWKGTPHPNESVWEYLTPSAKIIKVEEF